MDNDRDSVASVAARSLTDAFFLVYSSSNPEEQTLYLIRFDGTTSAKYESLSFTISFTPLTTNLIGTIKLQTIGSVNYHDVQVSALSEGFGNPSTESGLDSKCYLP